jgi:hypothetical protein
MTVINVDSSNRSAHMTTYRECQHISKSMNESKDCTVKGLAIATGIPYERAQEIMRYMGRRPNKGLKGGPNRRIIATMQTACKLAGRIVDSPQFPERLTMNTVGERYSKGTYMVFTSGHVAALVNGQVQDWSEGRRNRVKFLFKVGV